MGADAHVCIRTALSRTEPQAPTSSNSFSRVDHPRAGRPPSNLDTPVKPIPAPRCRRSSTPLAPHFEYENFLHSGPCAPDSAHPGLHREEPHRGGLPSHGNSSSGAPKPSTPIGFLSCTAPTPVPRPPSGWSLGRAKRRESNDADRASTSPARCSKLHVSRSVTRQDQPVSSRREHSVAVVHLIVDTSERSLRHHSERDFCDGYSERHLHQPSGQRQP